MAEDESLFHEYKSGLPKVVLNLATPEPIPKRPSQFERLASREDWTIHPLKAEALKYGANGEPESPWYKVGSPSESPKDGSSSSQSKDQPESECDSLCMCDDCNPIEYCSHDRVKRECEECKLEAYERSCPFTLIEMYGQGKDMPKEIEMSRDKKIGLIEAKVTVDEGYASVGVYKTFSDYELKNLIDVTERGGKANTELRLLIGEYQALRQKARMAAQNYTDAGGLWLIAQKLPETKNLKANDQAIVAMQKLEDQMKIIKDGSYRIRILEAQVQEERVAHSKTLRDYREKYRVAQIAWIIVYFITLAWAAALHFWH